jgi:hypothetical protein
VTVRLGVAARAWPRSDNMSVHARAQSIARTGSDRDLRAGDAGEILSVHRWHGGELDKGENNVATWRAWASQRTMKAKVVAYLAVVPGAAKRAVLPLALSGLAVASQLHNDGAAAVQRGRGGNGVERPLCGTRWDATA